MDISDKPCIIFNFSGEHIVSHYSIRNFICCNYKQFNIHEDMLLKTWLMATPRTDIKFRPKIPHVFSQPPGHELEALQPQARTSQPHRAPRGRLPRQFLGYLTQSDLTWLDIGMAPLPLGSVCTISAIK